MKNIEGQFIANSIITNWKGLGNCSYILSVKNIEGQVIANSIIANGKSLGNCSYTSNLIIRCHSK